MKIQKSQGKHIRFPLRSVGYELSSRAVSSQVLSPLQSLTSVFGMGTGGPSALKTLTAGFPPLFGTRFPLTYQRERCGNDLSFSSLRVCSSPPWRVVRLRGLGLAGRRARRLSGSVSVAVLTAHRAVIHCRSASRSPRSNGAPSGTRTPDPLIKSQLLYQLS